MISARMTRAKSFLSDGPACIRFAGLTGTGGAGLTRMSSEASFASGAGEFRPITRQVDRLAAHRPVLLAHVVEP